VHTAPLTYIPLCVEFGGPYKCLVDSGSELAIAKRSVVDGLVASKRSAGQIRLQGIFGEPVIAELISLRVCIQDKLHHDIDNMTAVPIVFAVTDAVVQDCDFILPFETVEKLKQRQMVFPLCLALLLQGARVKHNQHLMMNCTVMQFLIVFQLLDPL